MTAGSPYKKLAATWAAHFLSSAENHSCLPAPISQPSWHPHRLTLRKENPGGCPSQLCSNHVENPVSLWLFCAACVHCFLSHQKLSSIYCSFFHHRHAITKGLDTKWWICHKENDSSTLQYMSWHEVCSACCRKKKTWRRSREDSLSLSENGKHNSERACSGMGPVHAHQQHPELVQTAVQSQVSCAKLEEDKSLPWTSQFVLQKAGSIF